MEHAVVVDNVTKKYGAVEALKGVFDGSFRRVVRYYRT